MVSMTQRQRARCPHPRVSPCALASLLLITALTVHAQPTGDMSVGVSVQEAVHAATLRARSPAVSDATALAAREMAVAAAQRPDPVLSLSLNNVPVDGPNRLSMTRDFMTEQSIAVMQTFTREEKRSARTQRFEREAEAAHAERRVRIASVQRSTAVAWFERHAAEQRQALRKQLRGESQLQVEAAEAALRGARATPVDLIAARNAIAQLEQSLLNSEAEVANARRILARWTGHPSHRPLANPPALTQSALVTHGLSDRLALHPDLLRLAAREAQAHAEAAVARAEREPDWSAELMYSVRGSRFSNMVSVQFSLPLPWDRPQRQDRELAARLSKIEALRAEREELDREYLAQTESWIEDWRAGLARIAFIDRDRAPLAQQRVDAALAAYRGGQSSLSLVLEARRAALELQMERIALELQTGRLWARLEYLIPYESPASATQNTSGSLAP